MLIDVMLPFYGDGGQFKAAVRSVLEQSHSELRLVVVDDRYPDPEPTRWVRELADPRVVYHRNSTNLGVNGNFRRCMELVEAPVFTVMGCDDLMRPEHLAAGIARLGADPQAAVAATRVRVIDGTGAPVRPLGDRIKEKLTPSASRLSGEELAASLYRGNWTYFPSLLWRTAVVQPIGFREGLEVVLDLALLVDIARHGASLALGSETTFDYRRHTESVSSVRAADGRRFTEERAFFANEARRCRELGWRRAARAARVHSTSRLNAAALLPAALRARKWSVAGSLARHVVG